MSPLVLGILCTSIVLQLAAAAFAVRLARRTAETPHAWLLLALAMVLMAGRRLVTLVETFVPPRNDELRAFAAETIGLVIACLMLAGVLRIPSVFAALAQAKDAAKDALRSSRFLAAAGEALVAERLGVADRAALITRLPLREWADACVVDLLAHDGRSFERFVAGEPPDLVCALRLARPEPDANGVVGDVLRSGEGVLVSAADRAAVAALLPERARVPIDSYIAVPLLMGGGRRGVLTMIAHARAPYSARELALARDFSRFAGLALENARLYGEAREAVEVRDRFLSIASHELRTPLTPLALHVQLLRKQASAGELRREAVERCTDAIDRQTRRLVRLIDELLDVSRITSGEVTLEREGVDLAGVVSEVVERQRAAAHRAGSEITVRSDAPAVGLWDRASIEQIVDNLLNNAVKFGAGHPIEIEVAAAPRAVRLELHDHGIGISLADQKRLFQRFERAVSDRHFGGLGLGLWIVRQTVDALGGEIVVRSEPGRGSTFTVVLPREPELAAAHAD